MTAGEGPILAARGVARTYTGSRSHRTVEALAPFDLEIRAAARIGIVGESGSGKTTVVRLLAGLDRPTAGSVEFRGAPLDSAHRTEFRRAVQVVFQDPRSSLDPTMKVWAAIAEPVRYLRTADHPKSRAEEAASLVGLESSLLSRRPSQLSGGQCQRVAIARAIACSPDVILADEPVSSLDSVIREDVLDLLDQLATTLRTALVVVSHDLSSIVRLCTDVVVLRSGTVAARGPVTATLGDSPNPYVRRLVAAVPRLAAD
jgi:peptide/nickel transport system ATP-binding protein